MPIHDMMPPEERYRPRASYGGGVVSTFLVVFLTVFTVLWLTTSVFPAMLFVIIFFGRVLFQHAAHSAAVEQNQTAVHLLNSGRVGEAAGIFDSLTSSERKTNAHPIYVFNRAVAFVLEGRPRRAYSLFNAINRSDAFSHGIARRYQPLLHVELGTCLALMGQLEEARGWRRKAVDRLHPRDRGRIVFLDALLHARYGDWAAGADYIAEHLDSAQHALREPMLRALHVLHAFALRQSGAPRHLVARKLEPVDPWLDGEFDWLGTDWPEMAKFLKTEGLT